MGRRTTTPVDGIPHGISRWWVERYMENGMTLEQAIEKVQGRVSAKDRFERRERVARMIREDGLE